jgi:hypothetical protein
MDNKKFVVGFTEADIEYIFNKSIGYVNYSELKESEKNQLLDAAQRSLDNESITFHIIEHMHHRFNDYWDKGSNSLIDTYSKFLNAVTRE